MADKVVSGIGRELRYFEYKFRKRQLSSKKNKKDKSNYPTQEHAWSGSTRSDDFQGAEETSEEFRKALPGSRGEEELQIQVALAMSHEEEKQRSKQLESDKVRLEMAMKESMKIAEEIKKQKAREPSLLDLSLRAQKPTASSNSADLFSSTAAYDPWGASAPVTTATTFDLFAPQQQAVSPQPSGAQMSASLPMATNSFTAPNNAWASPQISSSTSVQFQDPWGGAPAQSITPQPTQFNAFAMPQANNPWGNPTSVTPVQNPFPATQGAWGNASAPAPSENAFPAIQNGAWGSPGQFSTTQAGPQRSFDPFSGGSTSSMTLPQSGGFAVSTTSAPVAQNELNNPFGFGDEANFEAPPFDPLKEFDSLHIGAGNRSSDPEPAMPQSNFGGGGMHSIAKDTLAFNQILEPTQASAVQVHNNRATSLAPFAGNGNIFLGENSSLVNLDSGWKTTQVPFGTKPLGTVNQNPFQQTGPVKTLNEMKTATNQPGF